MGFQFQGKRLKEVVCYFIKNILDRLPKFTGESYHFK